MLLSYAEQLAILVDQVAVPLTLCEVHSCTSNLALTAAAVGIKKRIKFSRILAALLITPKRDRADAAESAGSGAATEAAVIIGDVGAGLHAETLSEFGQVVPSRRTHTASNQSPACLTELQVFK